MECAAVEKNHVARRHQYGFGICHTPLICRFAVDQELVLVQLFRTERQVMGSWNQMKASVFHGRVVECEQDGDQFRFLKPPVSYVLVPICGRSVPWGFHHDTVVVGEGQYDLLTQNLPQAGEYFWMRGQLGWRPAFAFR